MRRGEKNVVCEEAEVNDVLILAVGTNIAHLLLSMI